MAIMNWKTWQRLAIHPEGMGRPLGAGILPKNAEDCLDLPQGSGDSRRKPWLFKKGRFQCPCFFAYIFSCFSMFFQFFPIKRMAKNPQNTERAGSSCRVFNCGLGGCVGSTDPSGSMAWPTKVATWIDWKKNDHNRNRNVNQQEWGSNQETAWTLVQPKKWHCSRHKGIQAKLEFVNTATGKAGFRVII